MRLIDRDELKKAMDGYWGRCQRIRKPRNGETAVFLDIKAIVETQPTVDAVPVRHGKWISHGDCGVTECSCCGWNIEECVGWNYCPNCGARMDVRKE